MTDELFVACKRAVHVVKADGTVLRGGRATMYAIRRLGAVHGFWRGVARFLSWPPMIWFVEVGYYIVARNRVFFSKLMMKDPSLRERREPKKPDA